MASLALLCLLFCVASASRKDQLQFREEQSWTQAFQNDVQDIIQYTTQGEHKGQVWEWLANVTDTFGHRLVGSKALDDAIDHVVRGAKQQGFDNVHTEDVPNLKHWIRGEETVELIEPRPLSLNSLAVGLSEGGEVTAEAIVVRSFAELDAKAKTDEVKGKIVVYNEPWVTYAKSVPYRSGANAASRHGAVAVLIRSVASFSINSPHTGMMSYDKDVKHIPAACIAVEDAEMLWRMQQRGQKLRMRVKMGARFETPVTSRNTIFELKGKEKPNEILMISGHFDSWDVGQGALDDGGGCATMWGALTALKDLGLRPKRTIRVVLWTAEEIGMAGAEYYYKQHKGFKNETFVFVSESDLGAWRPDSWGARFQFSGPASYKKKMRDVVNTINANGIKLSLTDAEASDQGDVAFWAMEGVPAAEYKNDDYYERYFYFHHTQGDMMTVLSKDDLDYLSAVYAILVHLLANME